MKLLIVRHAETLDNLRNVCQGQTDGTLSPLGIKQAFCTGLRLQNTPIDLFVCSDLGRARETLSLITPYHPNRPIWYDARLRERYFASFQGRPFPPDIDQQTLPPEVETPQEIYVRLSSFLAALTSNPQLTSDTVLLLSHGFTLRVLTTLFRQQSPEYYYTVPNLHNCSISLVDQRPNKQWSELFWDDTSHLATLPKG